MGKKPPDIFAKTNKVDTEHNEPASASDGADSSLVFGKRSKLVDTIQHPFDDDLATGTSSSSSGTAVLQNQQDKIADLKPMIKDLFLKNKLSAKETIQLAMSSQHAGAVGVGDLAAAAGKLKKNWKNAHRDLLRKLLKSCELPQPYYGKVRVKNLQTLETETVYMPVLLPHEVLQSIACSATSEELELWATSSEFESDVIAFAAEWNCSASDVFVLGLHGDGVPFKAKMEDSLEQLSWSFASDPQSTRVLFATIAKSFVVDSCTFFDLFQIFSASMRQLALGQWLTCRFDNEPWHKTDAWRSRQSGPLRFRGVLLQVRGDWMFYKQMFHFPSWSAKRICWKCEACSDELDLCNYKNCSSTAQWRVKRLTQDSFFQQLLEAGLSICPSFTCPRLKVSHVQIDWLHTMDLGVS